VGANVHELRTKEGWTQAELAEAASLEPRSVSRIELAEIAPTIQTLVRLADALGVPVAKLLRPATKPKTKPGRPRKRPT